MMTPINVRSSAIAENVRANTPRKNVPGVVLRTADWLLDNIAALLVGVLIGYMFGTQF